MKTPPASEEKFWAVLSHLAALAGGIGLIIPAFGWAESRKKPGYAAFQSLQALGYQSLGYSLWTLAYLVILVIMVIVAPPPQPAAGSNSAELGTWLVMHVLVTLGLYGIYLLFPVIGAVMCVFGRDFRYPVLGNRLARYLNYDASSMDAALNEQHEEQFAAAMGHFCIIFPLSGVLVPLALLVTQDARSRYMKFQALQTIIFQAVAALVALILGLLVFLILVIVLLQFFSAPDISQPSIETIFGIFIFLICGSFVLLIVPLFQVLGQWAGLRILQGHDYHYPIIGGLVENRLAKRETPS